MARIPFVDPDDPDTDPHAAAYLRGVHDVQGVTLNVHRALANHPVLMEKIFEMGEVAYFNLADPLPEACSSRTRPSSWCSSASRR